MRALTARRAARVLAADVELFERLGYRRLERAEPFEVGLRGKAGRRDLVLQLTREGRVFGGNWGLEVSTAEPVLPPTRRGLTARGRGVVRMQGVGFRARRRDDAAADELARALSADAELGEALGRVDFERLSVRPDGRPVIRHLGGSLVWVLFPPIVRGTPLPPEQARELVRSLDAFAAAGQRAGATARDHHASNSSPA